MYQFKDKLHKQCDLFLSKGPFPCSQERKSPQGRHSCVVPPRTHLIPQPVPGAWESSELFQGSRVLLAHCRWVSSKARRPLWCLWLQGLAAFRGRYLFALLLFGVTNVQLALVESDLDQIGVWQPHHWSQRRGESQTPFLSLPVPGFPSTLASSVFHPY